MSPVLSFDPQRESREEQTRTRRSMTASVLLHAVLLLLILRGTRRL